MRCIPARVGLALFLPCADLLSCEVLAQGTEARQGSEENVRHWHQSAEFISSGTVNDWPKNPKNE